MVDLHFLRLGGINGDVILRVYESQAHIISNSNLMRERFLSSLVQLLDGQSNNSFVLTCRKNYLEKFDIRGIFLRNSSFSVGILDFRGLNSLDGDLSLSIREDSIY
jgi:hypothetical protein